MGTVDARKRTGPLETNQMKQTLTKPTKSHSPSPKHTASAALVVGEEAKRLQQVALFAQHVLLQKLLQQRRGLGGGRRARASGLTWRLLVHEVTLVPVAARARSLRTRMRASSAIIACLVSNQTRSSEGAVAGVDCQKLVVNSTLPGTDGSTRYVESTEP